MNPPNSPGLAPWLKKKCQQEGLSLRQAGAKVGLSHGTIADILAGKMVSPPTLIKLARAFSNGNHHRQALQDELLVLVGYRMASEDISPPLAKLIDSLKDLTDPQLNLVKHFADFLVESKGIK